MQDSPKRISPSSRTSLASLVWLKYLGIVAAVLIIYAVSLFFYRFGDDIFPKALSTVQLIQLGFYSLGSQIPSLVIPLLFFSGALLYRHVRRNGVNPSKALKRDLIIILPIGLLLWLQSAFFEASVKDNFYSMLYEVQQLKPGEKLVRDTSLFDMMRSPNLNGLHDEIDTLNHQIEGVENKLVEQLVVLNAPTQLDSLLHEIDFGSTSLKAEDFHNSSKKWDGIRRNTNVFRDPPLLHYIETLIDHKNKIYDNIRTIHFQPIYILLFFLFGILLGYLIPIHRAALIAILIAIGYAWLFGTSLLESMPSMKSWTESSFILGKIGILILVNLILMIVAIRSFNRTKMADL